MTRVLQAARMHLINPAVALGIPWLVVALSFAINLAIWHLTPVGSESDGGGTGGVAALYITVLFMFVIAVTQLLPFAMGVSLSRRAFYLGTALVVLAESLYYGIAISVLVSIENATDGWGTGLDYWAPGILDVGNPVLQVFASGALMAAAATIGVGMGIVHQRWGQAGTWGLIIGSLIFFGGIAIVISALEAWQSVGDWLAGQSALTLTIGFPIALAVAVALLAYPGIRRVVP